MRLATCWRRLLVELLWRRSGRGQTLVTLALAPAGSIAALLVTREDGIPAVAAAPPPPQPHFFKKGGYQEFVDHYPITRFGLNMWDVQRHGHTGAAQLPSLLHRFDWFIDHFAPYVDLKDWFERYPAEMHEFMKNNSAPDQYKRRDPQTVFASAFSLQNLLSVAEQNWDPMRQDRVIVFGGTDEFLSDAFGASPAQRLAVVARLRKYFRAIFYYAKDVETEGVRTMPLGLDESYLRGGVEASAARAIADASIDSKTRVLLCAWSVTQGTNFSSFAWFTHRGSAAANGSRALAELWAATPAAKEAGAELRTFSRLSWWQEMATYKFVLSPLGAGIQSPKMVEALLVLAVPVVEHGGFPVFHDLTRMGWPLAVVDAWAQITAPLLERCWSSFAPRLRGFRRRCLTAEAFWRIFTQRTERCT